MTSEQSLAASAGVPPPPSPAPQEAATPSPLPGIRSPFDRILSANHTFILPPQALRRGLVSRGDRARLRRFLLKLAHVEPVRVGFLGGSITRGHGASRPGATDFAARFSEWILALSPGAVLSVGAVPASSSRYHELCMGHHLQADNDLVVVELGINDGAVPYSELHQAHERVVRRLLAGSSRPALVEAFFYEFREATLPWGPPPPLFGATGADALGVLAQYYGLPFVSFRNAAWRGVQGNVTGLQARDLLLGDRMHPTDRGSHVMLDLLVGLMREEASALGSSEPWGEADEAVLAEALPSPMFKDNEDGGGKGVCFTDERARVLVDGNGTSGFEWVDEARAGQTPKWGFVGRAANDTLELELDTTTPLSAEAAAKPDAAVNVGMLYLQSYEKMGRAEWTCVAGCTCKTTTLDGLTARRVSETAVNSKRVSAHESCRMRLRIVPYVNVTQEPKFKYVGVAVSTGF
ncbi:hypothetical protein H632_c6p4 [Helicosporidium sp. ATCC 50920]|nr:hypothetical protein H632_c6p4 [Helicosporidium sp. ATCC 50920]|eukprot:KDD77160.1 hypothetical protein H632_c6p4 [Helicosporidium sp. ATCC 50920]